MSHYETRLVDTNNKERAELICQTLFTLLLEFTKYHVTVDSDVDMRNYLRENVRNGISAYDAGENTSRDAQIMNLLKILHAAVAQPTLVPPAGNWIEEDS